MLIIPPHEEAIGSPATLWYHQQPVPPASLVNATEASPRRLRPADEQIDTPRNGAPNHSLRSRVFLDMETGVRIGPYRIEGEVGRGGMGIVFAAVHEQLGRRVAVKQLAPALTRQPEFRERFSGEARAQARLQHPNVVSVYDLLETDGEFFLVMEYVEGTALGDHLAARPAGCLPWKEAIGLLAQVLEALDYAHARGVIHRDVKPSNVIVCADGRIKLTDFGIALLAGDPRLTVSQSVIGTPTYMSPEQILRPREVDRRTDLYSAAVVLYEMLAGAPPFEADNDFQLSKLQIEAPPPDLGARVPGLPQEVTATVARALAKAPEERFPDARAFLAALRAGAATPAPRPPETGTFSAFVRRRGQAAALALGTASLLAGAGLAWWTLRADPPARMPQVETSAKAVEPGGPPHDLGATQSAAEGAAISTVPPQPETGPEKPEANPVEREPGEELAPKPERLPPRPVRDPTPVQAVADEREVVEAIRARVRSGLEQAEAQFVAGDLEDARTTLAPLSALAAGNRAGLVEELVSLRLLEERITDEIVARRAAEREEVAKEALQRAAWQRRLSEIEELIAAKSYPEAKKLAGWLAGEAGAPPEVVERARTLSKEAEKGLKEVFSDSGWTTTNEIQRKPPVPR